MGNYKCTGLLYLREHILKSDPEVQKRFLAALTPQEEHVFRFFTAMSWIPLETATKFFVSASPLLFPDNRRSSSMQQLGKASMDYNLKGIYRLALKFATVNMIFQNAVKAWRTYHDTGEASLEIRDKNSLLFKVKYAGLPSAFPENITGCAELLAELAGIQNSAVQYYLKDSIYHNWLVAWK